MGERAAINIPIQARGLLKMYIMHNYPTKFAKVLENMAEKAVK